MTETEKYFIYLLSTHLNNEIPAGSKDVNWGELYKLANLHNLTGVIGLEIKKLNDIDKPSAKAISYFNQAVGMTIQNNEFKQDAIDYMIKILADAGIKHTIIKGGAIRSLYPVPSVRTSGDTDVVISQDDLEKVSDLLQSNGFELVTLQSKQVVLNYNNQEFQFKTFFDSLVDYQYSDYEMESSNGYTYYLKPLECLHYIILHLLKHLKGSGFGFRQLMDVDVVLRAYNIDLNKFLSMFNDYGLTKSASVILALTRSLFNTPIDFNYTIDNDLYDKLLSNIISGGVFGFKNADIGTVRLVNSGSKGKAILNMLFPSKEYIYTQYLYANKHHILLPIAYLHRFFMALFKRRKSNSKYLKSIVKNDDMAIKISDIINELDI